MNLEKSKLAATQSARVSLANPGGDRTPISTQFGEIVDVRNRGALRLSRGAGSRASSGDAPAVVRIWNGDKCRELSINEARALAAQLVQAARFVEIQNAH